MTNINKLAETLDYLRDNVPHSLGAGYMAMHDLHYFRLLEAALAHRDALASMAGERVKALQVFDSPCSAMKRHDDCAVKGDEINRQTNAMMSACDGATLARDHEEVIRAALMAPAVDVEKAPAQGWLPIESAPKDGTHVLFAGREFNKPDGAWWVCEGWIEFNERLCFDHDEGQIGTAQFATLWQPLPPPPADDTTKEADNAKS